MCNIAPWNGVCHKKHNINEHSNLINLELLSVYYNYMPLLQKWQIPNRQMHYSCITHNTFVTHTEKTKTLGWNLPSNWRILVPQRRIEHQFQQLSLSIKKNNWTNNIQIFMNCISRLYYSNQWSPKQKQSVYSAYKLRERERLEFMQGKP